MCDLKSKTAEPGHDEGQYRELVESVNSIILRLDTNGNVLFANRFACDFFGYTKDELIGKNVVGTIVPAVEGSGRNLAEFVRDVFGHPERHEKEENENFRKDGSRVWVYWTNKAIRDASGKLQEILSIGNDITARKRVEEKLHQEQQMLRRLLESQRHELQLIAYELHDGLAQLLTATVLQLQVFEHLHEDKPKEARKAYQTARDTLDQAMAETRRLIQGLRPAVLEESGIATAIKLLLAEREEQSGIRMEFDCDVQFKRLDSLLENALYRIAQEGLTNAARYSNSKIVRVTLRQKNSRVTLEIQDWGCGFDAEAVGSDHFGLEGIRERASILDGLATIESAPGRGTTISVELPMVFEKT